MKCSEKSVLQQQFDDALEEYRRVEVEFRQACEDYVATGQVRESPSPALRYRAWLKASRALDRHCSDHRC